MNKISNKLNIKIFTPVNFIGFILVMMAGWIDTIGVCLFLDERSSFMTGRAAKLGKYIFYGETQEIKIILLVILSFIMGACISTLITRKTGLIGGLSFTSVLIILTVFSTFYKGINIASITIPMSMGSQNAATSLTDINRTTHLTGPATDIGINIAKGNWNLVVFWALRWIGFSMGAAIAFDLLHTFESKMISFSHTLLIPAVIILVTGIVQKKFFPIPLSEDIRKLTD
ncbi:YoaK family protein [Anaerosalibacter sp. Marseille-P3206]|uniref:YoaK family protein n=1 Tax=Anaerosalibacter sp. Marseille-P3206 TaxID=1871005 RepID=UPI0009846D30|nr:YoaK family protein [Anaerosalibacter sp. Marseille-P3206]